MRSVDAGFVDDVVAAFGLGSTAGITVEPMVGSANRLWRFSTRREQFVVKEFAHDGGDDLQRRRRAASFERSVFESALVRMPEPVVTADGEIVVRVRGSRGEPLAVRVHRWLDGTSARRATLQAIEAAGAVLQVIQTAGAAWSAVPTGSIRWWDAEPPLEVVDRVRSSELAWATVEARPVVRDALEIVGMAEQIEGSWVYSHCDHKPENAFVVHGQPAVLDWDECGHCHPRLEAVEAALRWAAVPDPRRELFERFLAGYVRDGANLDQLSERDFGKWLAALLRWFSFQARRALGDWDSDTPDERTAAAAMAIDAVDGLRSALSALPTWSSWWR